MTGKIKLDGCLLLYESSTNSATDNRNIDLAQSKETNTFELLLGPWLFL